jgi:hypothetical protein
MQQSNLIHSLGKLLEMIGWGSVGASLVDGDHHVKKRTDVNMNLLYCTCFMHPKCFSMMFLAEI